MNYPSLESILSLSLEPQVDWSAIEELAGDVYEGLEVAEELLARGAARPARQPALETARNALVLPYSQIGFGQLSGGL